MKYLTLGLLMTCFAVGCTGRPTPAHPLPPDTAVTRPPEGTLPATQAPGNPLAPQPGDETLARGAVYIQDSRLVIRESFPPQISLMVSGELPTPCHQLRAVIQPPDQENKIGIEAYSVVDPDQVCVQVLQPFEHNLDLGTYPSGHYTVWINGEAAGEFDA